MKKVIKMKPEVESKPTELKKAKVLQNDLAPKVKETVPRILLEIFLYGEEKDKKKIRSTIEELSKQLNQARGNKNKCRVLWYLDNGEKSIDEKIEWFHENTNCKYFIELDGTKKIEKNFMKDSLQKIRTFENSFNNLKSSGIKIFGKHKNSKNNNIKDAVEVE